ncbi:hypothetical protein ACFYU8_18365 [Brevibacillus sp. NPDC003359]|uniref:hypothetical protein n=1 Tax=unclassified Brevibacillus TaxID=2684853 RepID=UPI00368E0385
MCSERINMISQAIINMRTDDVFAEEWLCRPATQTISDYFNVNDPFSLWQREKKCLEKGIAENSKRSKMLNLTVSSLPYFLVSDLHWEGGLEIVEWGPALNFSEPTLQSLITCVQEKGIEVWVDDLSPHTWGALWRNISVNGYKVVAADVLSNTTFLKELTEQNRPLIVEHVDSLEMREKLLEKGLVYGQGYYFDY